MTVLEARNWLGQKLDNHEVFLLLENLLKQSKTELLLMAQMALSESEKRQLKDCLDRRLAGEPLQHIIKKAFFYDLSLSISKDVLIPRPETEVLVHAALKEIRKVKNPLILDVGTGSGAIALSIKHEHPEATVFASDVSEIALQLAQKNAQRLGLSIEFYVSDLFANAKLWTQLRNLDFVLANLPYLPDEDKARVSKEVQHEPEIALYSGEDGLALFRRFEAEAFKCLKQGAICWFELDPRNIHQAHELCLRWSKQSIHKDLLDRERFLRLVR